MTPQQFLTAMELVPYLRNGNSFLGMDCWGLVEAWHMVVHGIEVIDRGGNESAPDGFEAGFEARSVWQRCEPQDNAVWTARAVMGRDIIQHGHCGLLWQGRAFHMQWETGFTVSNPADPKLRINGFWIHQCLQ